MAAPDSQIPPLDGDASAPPTGLRASPPHRGRPSRGRRILGALLGVLLLGASALLAARVLLGGDTMRAKVKARVTSLVDQRLGGGSVGDDYQVDWLGRIQLGPVRLGAPGAAPTVEVAWISVRPSYRALLSGKALPASVLLHDVRVDAGQDGQNLSALFERIQHPARPKRSTASVNPTELPRIRFDTLRVTLTTPRLEVPLEGTFEGGRVELRRSVVGGELEARATLKSGGALWVQASWSRNGPFSFELALRDATPAALPAPLRQALPFQVREGRLNASVRTLAPAGLHRGALRISTDVSSLTLEGDRLADGPVGPMRVGFAGELRWDTAWRRLTLEQGTLTVGPHAEASAQLEADLVLRGEPRFSVSARVEKLAYQMALDALPAALVPGEDAPRLDGTMTASLAVSGPLRSPDAWKVEAKLDLSDLKKAARQQAPSFLERPFEYRAVDANGREQKIWVGPKNHAFVPLASLPVYVYRAVTTSEDAGFFAHHGFDFDELKNSIVADAAAGRAVRGGSTITQQLAKNLFLSRQKTYARKVREALITIALESSLSKQRLLEIYLNIIEWGPGIHGLGEAARHYFDKEPQALTPKEAAFLATIIPNPVRYHMYYERGALTEVWEKHVDELLTKLAQVNVITPDQLATALETPLTFAKATPAQR